MIAVRARGGARGAVRASRALAVLLIAAARLGSLSPVAGAADTRPVGAGQRCAYNIIVLLDLSNRIDPVRVPGQWERDQRLLEGLLDEFEGLVKRDIYIDSRDVFRIAIAPQPTGYDELADVVGDSLVIDMSRSALGGRPAFQRNHARVERNLRALYQAARRERRYVGADIWRWVRDSLPEYLAVSDETRPYRHVLLIITDGYLDFDASVNAKRPTIGNRTAWMAVSRWREMPSWEAAFSATDAGLLRIGQSFPNLNVMMLEVNLRDVRDRDIVAKYWSKWFREMGVGRWDMKTRDTPTTRIQETVRQFIVAAR